MVQYYGMAAIEEIARTLEQIGLTQKQALVYVTLATLESSTAYQISQHCEIKKPTVYVVLEELRQKGLTLKVPHPKKALYAARDISEFLAEKKKKLELAASVVPQILSLSAKEQPRVYFFQGIRGFEQSLDFKFDAMRGKTFHSFYSNLAGVGIDVIRRYAEWDRRAVNSDIRFKIIMGKDGSGKYYKDIIELGEKSENVAIKYLRDFAYPSNSSIEIGEDFVRLVNEKAENVTIIDDVATAEAMRQIFTVVWEKGV